MILAAGRGRRMGGLTDSRPKPLLEVGGTPLIDRNLAAIARGGLTEAVSNLSWHGEQIRYYVGDGSRWGLSVAYSVEPEPPLETAGGVVAALPLLGAGPFLLINADVYSDIDLAAVAARQRTLVLVPNPPHHPDGDFCLGSDGMIGAAGRRLTFSGISVLDSAMFAAVPPGAQPLKPVLDRAIERGELAGVVHPGLWLDVGTPERLREADRLARA